MSTHESVHPPESPISTRRLRRAGAAAVVACAACCALPAAAAGLGGGAAAWLAHYFAPGSELVVASVAFAAALGVMTIAGRGQPAPLGGALHTKKRNECGGGGCGCGPAPESGTKPSACTLAAPELGARAEAFRAVFAHLAGSESFAGGFRWRFRLVPGLEDRLQSLAESERECCSFLEFRVYRVADAIVWETRSEPHSDDARMWLQRLPAILR